MLWGWDTIKNRVSTWGKYGILKKKKKNRAWAIFREGRFIFRKTEKEKA